MKFILPIMKFDFITVILNSTIMKFNLLTVIFDFFYVLHFRLCFFIEIPGADCKNKAIQNGSVCGTK